jgi:DNA-binding protein HU-beta
MNKKQFIERMVEHTASPFGEAGKHLEAFTRTITEALKGGEEVQLPGFGKFYVREQKAREGKNPQTRERMACSLPTHRGGGPRTTYPCGAPLPECAPPLSPIHPIS